MDSVKAYFPYCLIVYGACLQYANYGFNINAIFAVAVVLKAMDYFVSDIWPALVKHKLSQIIIEDSFKNLSKASEENKQNHLELQKQLESIKSALAIKNLRM